MAIQQKKDALLQTDKYKQQKQRKTQQQTKNLKTLDFRSVKTLLILHFIFPKLYSI